MFEHKHFKVINYDTLLHTECFIIDEIYLNDYELYWINIFNDYDSGKDLNQSIPPGYITPVVIEKINLKSLDLSWFLTVMDRFHKLDIVLPLEELTICVGNRVFDDKIHLFVKSNWLEHLFLKNYSVFGLIDAIGTKDAIKDLKINSNNLINLRNSIDKLASRYREISFISFADTLLLKSNWNTSYFKQKRKYTYNPEIFILVFKELKKIYSECLGLDLWNIYSRNKRIL